jgi:alkylation response protein AidB-like acyl-CoA dehydrogenase
MVGFYFFEKGTCMSSSEFAVLKTLPGDDVRQIMWRMTDRFDLQMVVQSTRSVARSTAAGLVATGARNTHDWTPAKASLLDAFDQAGVTTVFLDQEFGGYIEGPKNMAIALVAFELAWVDAGAATCNLAGNLALEPIAEKGTYEQRKEIMTACDPSQPGETARGAFVLTEPLPYVGVDAAALSGKITVAEWEEGKEPILHVEKRGRFITNMEYANFVTAAVDTADERIKSSCMVIMKKGDEGSWDAGAPTLKMVHQLSATNDPIFSIKIPASRIIGGYTIKDGAIYPNCSHAEVIEATFRRTRVTVALMSSAKLLSAIEPVIRYHRTRHRGGEASKPGTPRFDLGIQQKDDAVQRLADVWAHGEASSSLGFAAARHFDDYDPIEEHANEILAKEGATSPRARMKALRDRQDDAQELISLMYTPESSRDQARYSALMSNPVVEYMVKDALAMVICPACKLWNTGVGATMMREAVSLVGGYGITEDCPGYLMHKWSDIQLEATYEGPEVVQRRQLTMTMTNPLFLSQFKFWILELKQIHNDNPNMGAAALAKGMELWLYTLDSLQINKDEYGVRLYQNNRQAVSFAVADALCWLLASRYQIMDVIELKQKGPENPILAEGIDGYIQFFSDLCIVQSSRSVGEASRICNELMVGYVTDADSVAGLEKFIGLKNSADLASAGARLARDRAGYSISQVMIPEALDYPM